MIPKKGLVLIGYDKPNLYSWAILMGYLETDPILEKNYTFLPLPFHIYESYKNINFIEKIDFESYDFVVLAYSLLSIQIPHLKNFINNHKGFFNNFHSNITSIVGGSHVTGDIDEFIKTNFDFIIPGEGEIAFSQLLHELLKKDKEDVRVQNISGLAKGHPKYIKAKPSKIVDLGLYYPFSEKYRFFGPIEISRGCSFQCKFCQTGNRSKKMRHAPKDKIIEWIKRASAIKYDKVWFLSPNAFAYGSKDGITPNPQLLYELLFEIHQIPEIKGIYFGTFPSEVRPGSVTREVLESVTPFISNKKILIGAQSASNRLLKKINRGHTFEDVLNAISLLNEFNLKSEIDFIFGLPGETEEDIQLNIDFFRDVQKNKIKNVRIHGHTFFPLPGTPFESEPRGKISPKLHKLISKLALSGKAYGEFEVQAGIVRNKYTK